MVCKQCCQEGGLGTLNADQLSTADHAEIQRAQAAQHTAESALEEVHAQLQEEHENAGRLYKALHVERQKVSRTSPGVLYAKRRRRNKIECGRVWFPKLNQPNT